MFFKKKNKPKAEEVTLHNFNEVVSQKDTAILLDFHASWCGPCKVLGPFVDELAGDFKDRAFIGKINIDQSPQLAQQFKVKSVPTLLFIKNRQVLERLNGLVPKPNLVEMMEDLIAYDDFDVAEEEE